MSDVPRSLQSCVLTAYVFQLFIKSSLLLSSSTRRRFYPQRSPGQAVVTGVVPSPPRYVPSFLSRTGFSIPTARRFSSNVATSRSRAFRHNNFFNARRIPCVRVRVSCATSFGRVGTVGMDEGIRGRSFHSKLFVSILNFQATEQPTRTENNPTDKNAAGPRSSTRRQGCRHLGSEFS